MGAETIIALTAALISALGLAGVAYALVLQVKQTKIAQDQTRISQAQAMRNFQLELFRMAYGDPTLQNGWGLRLDADLPHEEWKLRTYTNLVWGYLHMGYKIGELSKPVVRRILAERMRTENGRNYWTFARSGYQDDISDERDRSFFEIADEEFMKYRPGSAEE